MTASVPSRCPPGGTDASHNFLLGGYCARHIENNLHWQLDVSFREDECRVRTDHAPANLSVIRRFALGLLKRETSCRRGIETKRLKCAASDEYREKALFNT
jgi:hypothetical protein